MHTNTTRDTRSTVRADERHFDQRQRAHTRRALRERTARETDTRLKRLMHGHSDEEGGRDDEE